MQMLSRLRVLTRREQQIQSLEVLAGMAPPDQPEQGQFAILVRHFLDRFFNSEMASADDEGKTRLIQVACATGLPGFIAAMYLWPAYHDMLRRHRPYWARVGDHYLFVVVSLVAMGIITLFEWDLFFPDLLDIFVLSSLPIKNQKLFLARIATVVIFIVGFLFCANILATVALPIAMDPPSLIRLLAGHVLAVAASGLFAATAVLAVQGVLLIFLGARLFRRISLLLQGFFITAFVMILFLYPALSGALPVLMHSNSAFVLYFPPFWFLGMYQRLMEGPSALPIYARLAQTGCTAMLWTIAAAIVSYPLAYWRRMHQLMEGAGTRDTRSLLTKPLNRALHATLSRIPVSRAVFHFISQTLLRVERYRIYLILYGGVGLALVTASILRLDIVQNHLRVDISPEGLQAAIPIVAFWTIAGLRTAFVSPANRQGSWIFRILHSKPTLDHLSAARVWVFTVGMAVTLATVAALHAISPAQLRDSKTIAGQVIVAAGLCLLLTDAFFLNVKIIPFTGMRTSATINLAFLLIPFVGIFPPLVLLTLSWEPWIEASVQHMAVVALLVIAAHLALQIAHRRIVKEHANRPQLDEDEEEFPMKLGLRY